MVLLDHAQDLVLQQSLTIDIQRKILRIDDILDKIQPVWNELITVIQQLVDVANGHQSFGSESSWLFPHWRMGGATTIQLGSLLLDGLSQNRDLLSHNFDNFLHDVWNKDVNGLFNGALLNLLLRHQPSHFSDLEELGGNTLRLRHPILHRLHCAAHLRHVSGATISLRRRILAVCHDRQIHLALQQRNAAGQRLDVLDIASSGNPRSATM